MKVLALNSSARVGRESKTEMLLEPLVQGMREAGAEVEVVNLAKKKINYCIGCFTCWTKTPGVCVHKDDMSGELFDKWVAADICVYATPLFHYTVNAEMKAFIERTLPAIEPYMILDDGGLVTHPQRYENLPYSVYLSVAGFPHMEVFDVLHHYVNYLNRHTGRLLAEIYRPGAESLDSPLAGSVKEAVLAATRQAGRELITDRAVSEATMNQITQPFGVEIEEIARAANMFWDSAIEHGVAPLEYKKRGIVPRPRDIEDFLLLMKVGFNPAKAAGLNAVVQFDFSGQVDGSCHLCVADGALTAGAGAAEKADAIIACPFELWADVMTGKAEAAPLFMEQKIKATGDLSKVMGMQQWFAQD